MMNDKDWFIKRIDDILCGIIEGATLEETKDALYEFVVNNLRKVAEPLTIPGDMKMKLTYAKSPPTDKVVKMTAFEKELRDLLNRTSQENDSDTPDFILARYLCSCLHAFNRAVLDRTAWYEPEDLEKR